MAEPEQLAGAVFRSQRAGADAEEVDTAGALRGVGEGGESGQVELGGGLLGRTGVGGADLAHHEVQRLAGAYVGSQVQHGPAVGAHPFGLCGQADPELGIAAQVQTPAEAVDGGHGGPAGMGEFGDGALGGGARVLEDQVGDAALGPGQAVLEGTDVGE